MWSDKESSIDFLNFNETAESIKDLITEKNLMPISVGVFGDWGAGKSTILELTKSTLADDEEDYIQVSFDAWMFQGYDDAKAALLETIAATLLKRSEADESLRAKAKDFAGRVNKIRLMGLAMDAGSFIAGVPTFGGFQKLFGMFTGGENGEYDFDDVKNGVEGAGEVANKNKDLLRKKKDFSPPKEIKEFRKAYSDLLAEFGKPLIVYVDNLDRCSPYNAISTLEAMRLFLFLPNTAFVIAADEDMIRLAVGEYHKGSSQRHQTDYLDKLIQIPIHVPRPGTLEIRAYLIMLVALDHGVTGKPLEALRHQLELNLKMSWKEDVVAIDDLLEGKELQNIPELRRKFVVAEQLAPLLAESSNINGNPRIVKRLLNQVRIRRKTALRRGMQLDEKTITKLVIFERCLGTRATNKFYEMIDSENGKPKILAELEADRVNIDEIALPEEWKAEKNFLVKWSKLTPKFSEVDLTPALYLSKENVPLGSFGTVMSGAAQKLVMALLKQSQRISQASSKAIEGTPPDDYVPAMDALLEKLRPIGDWSKRPDGIFGARLLAEKDIRCKATFLDFMKQLPPARWMTPIIEELEGAN